MSWTEGWNGSEYEADAVLRVVSEAYSLALVKSRELEKPVCCIRFCKESEE